MFLLLNTCSCIPNLFVSRAISYSSPCYANHYMTLGLTPGATTDEIKTAYFDLCKKYHPDKNEGSDESTKMFRSITEAYEILGNEKSRKLYDSKMCFGAARAQRSNVSQAEDYNYEAEKNFYVKTNLRKRFTGKTWYYDFDAWNNAHYPKTHAGSTEDLNSLKTNRKARKFNQTPTIFTRSLFLITVFSVSLIIVGSVLLSIPSVNYSRSYYFVCKEKADKKYALKMSDEQADSEKETVM